MSELPPAQFRKTKAGKWAVMAPVESLEAALAEGGKVDVLKKSGDWSKFTVGSLGKPFDVDGIQMCYGYGPDDGDDSSTGSAGSAGSTGSASSRRSSPQPGAASAPPPLDERPPDDSTWANAPVRDESEPLPEFRGEAEDEWEEF